jgi:uncharacterized coiled-coil protein SlyX
VCNSAEGYCLRQALNRHAPDKDFHELIIRAHGNVLQIFNSFKVDSLSEPHILLTNAWGRERGDTGGGYMSEKRFTALETMVAYHEDTIQKLNDVVYKQQVMIDRLMEKIDSLARHFKNADQPVADESDK